MFQNTQEKPPVICTRYRVEVLDQFVFSNVLNRSYRGRDGCMMLYAYLMLFALLVA